MGSGSLRELLVLEKIAFGAGGGLRDGCGCAHLFGSTTHGLESKMGNCRGHEQAHAILQGPNAFLHVSLSRLLTVAHSKV